MQLSEELGIFLKDSNTKNTLFNLLEAIKGKSFALVMLILMLPAALPIPTAGITHILEAFAVIVALQMIPLRDYPWLPQKLLHYELKWSNNPKFISVLQKLLTSIEKYLRPRFEKVLETKLVTILTGIFFVVFALVAFFAPLGTGLDTLPALGIVICSLSLLTRDSVMWLAGVGIGILGSVLVGVAYYFGIEIFGYLFGQLANLVRR